MEVALDVRYPTRIEALQKALAKNPRFGAGKPLAKTMILVEHPKWGSYKNGKQSNHDDTR